MRKQTLLIAVMALLSSWLSLSAQIGPGGQVPTTNIPEDEAYQLAKDLFSGRDVDFFRYDAPQLEGHLDVTWHFFVDAQPTQNWPHECYRIEVPKMIFGTTTGTPTATKTLCEFPPLGDYFVKNTKNRYGSQANVKPHVRKLQTNTGSNPVAGRTYAVIISGGVAAPSNYERYWNDCSFIYQTLVNRYEVPKANIFVAMSDGTDPGKDMLKTTGEVVSQPLDLDFDGVDDIQYAATYSNILKNFKNLQSKINEDDHLFVFVIDHGSRSNGVSSICLWNGQSINSSAFKSILKPFSDKYANLNIVLGQCFSGGFVEDLKTLNCVVATASEADKPSYGSKSPPFDPFVYQWTCAVNGANHSGSKVNADANNDGHVTMDEAFAYAVAHDSMPEKPQYSSTPLSVGEDLAFTHLAPAVDLYIMDNPEDTGKEPNLTTEWNWASPSIWVRNNDDGIEKHENPYYSDSHRNAYIYVKINNRGKKDYTRGQYIQVYWAQASTSFSEIVWKGGEVSEDGHVTGYKLPGTMLPAIKAGGTFTISRTWELPSDLFSNAENEPKKHHFCILAAVTTEPTGKEYTSSGKLFDVLGSRKQAQKNVSIIKKSDLAKGTKVYVRNVNNVSSKYSLSFEPRTISVPGNSSYKADDYLFKVATVELELGPTLANGWRQEGMQCVGAMAPALNTSNVIRITNPVNSINAMRLGESEFDEVTLKINFNVLSSNYPQSYTYDLIQRDENGKIIGGETFIIEAPTLSVIPIGINSAPKPDGSIELTTDAAENTSLTWSNENDECIGNTPSVTVLPLSNSLYKVSALDEEGNVSIGSIVLADEYGIESIQPYSDSNNTLRIALKRTALCNSKITVTSVQNQGYKEYALTEGEDNITIDISDMQPGTYVVSYVVNGEVFDSKKFNK